MRNPEQTIGNLVDKATLITISYIDADGFPATKAMFHKGEE